MRRCVSAALRNRRSCEVLAPRSPKFVARERVGSPCLHRARRCSPPVAPHSRATPRPRARSVLGGVLGVGDAWLNSSLLLGLWLSLLLLRRTLSNASARDYHSFRWSVGRPEMDEVSSAESRDVYEVSFLATLSRLNVNLMVYINFLADFS